MGKHRRINSNKNNDRNSENSFERTPKNSLTVWSVFVIGFIIIILSVSSAVFPALLISIVGDGEFLDPFEMSSTGPSIITINLIIIGLIVIHNRKLLPESVTNTIQRIFSFELSRKNSLVLLIIILAVYISISMNELTLNELNQYGDYLILEDALRIWPDGKTDNLYVTEQITRHVRMALLSLSNEVFDNIKVIPFLASIFLLIITYFLTIKFSKKNFIGLIAVVLVIQSSTFFTYDSIAVYENFWALFYVVSIYLIFQKPKISSISFLLSIFSKAITILMLPTTIIVTILSDINNKKKIFVIITNIIAVVISIIIFQLSGSIYSNVIDINPSEFLTGFTTLAFNLRFDVVLLLFLLPTSIGLFIKAKNGSRNAISLMVLMCGTILVTPFLEMITNFYFVYPYRYIPLVIFFAISLSSLFSKE